MQQTLTAEEIIQIWISETDKVVEKTPDAIEASFQFRTELLRLLAQGKPVSPEQLADATSIPIAELRLALDEFAAKGGEFNDDGHVVGAALTLNPTPHHFRVNGHDLYAWCALDTLFLPGLLGQTAAVKSTCPVTGTPIQLTVTPEGVATYSPQSTVLSITVPGVSCSRETTGPQSDTCSQIYFFNSREAAETWVATRSGIAIFTVAEAYKLARLNWIKRADTKGCSECC